MFVCVIMSDLLSCFVLFLLLCDTNIGIVNVIFVGNGFSLAVYWFPCFSLKGICTMPYTVWVPVYCACRIPSGGGLPPHVPGSLLRGSYSSGGVFY